jgi:hypothetical protein
MRNNLQAALKEKTPPSITAFAQRYDYSRVRLKKQFPKLCRLLSRRHIVYRNNCTKEKKKLLEKQIEKITLRLLEEGVYPSQPRVQLLLVNPPIKGWKILDEILQRVRMKMGIANYGQWIASGKKEQRRA